MLKSIQNNHKEFTAEWEAIPPDQRGAFDLFLFHIVHFSVFDKWLPVVFPQLGLYFHTKGRNTRLSLCSGEITYTAEPGHPDLAHDDFTIVRYENGNFGFAGADFPIIPPQELSAVLGTGCASFFECMAAIARNTLGNTALTTLHFIGEYTSYISTNDHCSTIRDIISQIVAPSLKRALQEALDKKRLVIYTCGKMLSNTHLNDRRAFYTQVKRLDAAGVPLAYDTIELPVRFPKENNCRVGNFIAIAEPSRSDAVIEKLRSDQQAALVVHPQGYKFPLEGIPGDHFCFTVDLATFVLLMKELRTPADS